MRALLVQAKDHPPAQRGQRWIVALLLVGIFTLGLLLGRSPWLVLPEHPSGESSFLAAAAAAGLALRPGVPELFKAADRSPLAAGPITVTRLDAKVLIPGAGEPVEDGTVIFDSSNRILFVGPTVNVPPDVARNVSVEVHAQAAMPGLWDCHTHFAGPLKEPGMNWPVDGPFGSAYPMNFVRFSAAVQELHDALQMGITSVREVGGPFSQALHELVRTGRVPAPNFHFAGRAIGMTSGHTDDQMVPLDFFRRMDVERGLTLGTLCDGVAECLKRTRENLRMQADVIKIMTTGGVLSEFDSPTSAELSPEEIRAITQDAKRAGRAVAAHAHGTDGIQNAIDGGVTSIEHGTWMTKEQAQQLKAKGYMIYTPTVTVTQELFNGTSKPSSLDDNQWRKGREALAHHSSVVRMASSEGVPIVTGTDCPNGCAEVGKEVNFLHMLGMTPLQAIKAATADAPRCMGTYGMMPRSGRLEVGYEADILALTESPISDLKVLTRKDSFKYVWKGGALVKSPTTSLAAAVSTAA